ncbi:MAG: DUF4229 domain-containing protein [Streptosporangiaceae bacterium]
MGAVLRYTAARAALFVAAGAVLYALGARGILLLLLALVVSALVSYPLLSRRRDDMSRAISRRVGRFKERVDAGAAAEDAAADRITAEEKARGERAPRTRAR